MMKTLLAAVAALALVAARPATAEEGGCKNCPHRAQAAAAAGEAKKAAPAAAAEPGCKSCPHHAQAAAEAKEGGAAEVAACPCAKDGKACSCGEKCQCPHCAAQKAAKKGDEKKS